jgi:DNA (cytosine-5)-methyltransferase 1
MIELTEEDKILQGYRFVDLFCGIGGFHLALSAFGAECVFASDINESACKVYEKNFHIKPMGDIKKIKCKEIPEHDILCAGFPCQPFSISGNQQGFNDPNGKLFFEIIRIARFHKPKMILLENVKNLMVHDNGSTLQTIKDKLTSIGYKHFAQVLNASDFGIPQARKRTYIIAFKNNLKIKEFSFPKGISDFKIVSDILEKESSDEYIIDKTYTINKELSNSITRSKKLVRIGKIGLGRQGERIYSVKGQATTLSAQGGGIGGKTGMYLVNGKVRRLSPRECARLMGFPDDFIMADSDYKCYYQFGNSVVVNVIQEIIKKGSKQMIKEEKNGKS